MTKIIMGVVVVFSLGLLMAGCGSSETTSNNSSAGNTAANNTNSTGTTTGTTTTATPATTSTATTSTTTASTSGDKTGVAVCDEYLEKFEACLSKVPEAARAQYKSSFEQTRKTWRDAAATPQGKAGLTQGCQAALNAAKQSMGAFGCSW
ncbi:MAG TPA: hypothetical protein VF723_17190 [Pyrinomonadaceae bacterium]